MTIIQFIIFHTFIWFFNLTSAGFFLPTAGIFSNPQKTAALQKTIGWDASCEIINSTSSMIFWITNLMDFPLVHYLPGINGLCAECAELNTNKPRPSHRPNAQFRFWVCVAPPAPGQDTVPEFQTTRWIMNPRALLIWATHAGRAGEELPREEETKAKKHWMWHCLNHWRLLRNEYLRNNLK